MTSTVEPESSLDVTTKAIVSDYRMSIQSHPWDRLLHDRRTQLIQEINAKLQQFRQGCLPYIWENQLLLFIFSTNLFYHLNLYEFFAFLTI